MRPREQIAAVGTSVALAIGCAAGEDANTSTHGRPNSPPGYVRARVAEMATHQSGTMPRESSTPVSASITGMEPVRMHPAPNTTPLPTRAPSATMQRDPIIVSSPTNTGAACAGSSTPPIPTPPDRWTRSPICAHEPTVAHVSTIVSAPTYAPMLT